MKKHFLFLSIIGLCGMMNASESKTPNISRAKQFNENIPVDPALNSQLIILPNGMPAIVFPKNKQEVKDIKKHIEGTIISDIIVKAGQRSGLSKNDFIDQMNKDS